MLSMVSGIYKIVNKINRKFYIGSAKNINKRWKRHLTALQSGKHENIHLQRAFDKYGQIAFYLEVIEYCRTDFLLILEQHYLDSLNPWDFNTGYNIGRKSSGGDNLSSNPRREEIIKLMVEKQTEEISKMSGEDKKQRWSRPGSSNGNWKGGSSIKKCLDCGKVISFNSKRCSVCSKQNENNPFFGKKHKISTIEKIRQAKIGIKNTTQAKSIIINNILFRSQADAAKHFKVSIGTISNWVSGKIKKEGITIQLPEKQFLDLIDNQQVQSPSAPNQK